MSDLEELEAFLLSSLFWFDGDYGRTICTKRPLAEQDLFANKIGLSGYTKGEIIHPIQDGYAKFAKERMKGNGFKNKKHGDYVKTFLSKYESEDKE